jgi:hypothetical protein
MGANLHRKNRTTGVGQNLVGGGQKSSWGESNDEVITLWEELSDEVTFY